MRNFALLLLALVAFPSANIAAEQPPNIVLILADDLGWTDLGCFGSGYYETPHIDSLCAQGLKLTSAYSNAPNCAPTRACLMTGQYTPRHGVYTVGSGARGLEKFRKLVPVENVTDLPLDRVTLADALRSAGYRTGMFGKWHLGAGKQHHPSRRGFDVAIETDSHHHFAPHFKTDPVTPVDEGTPRADFQTDLGIKFLEENRERPFFLYLPYHLVHTDIEAREADVVRFKDKTPAGGHHDPTYAAMLASLDDNVGRVLDALHRLDLAQRTLVIFTSDNGGVGGYGTIGGPTGRNITDNAPLRGGKGMIFEGGIRVPMIARWPGVIDPGAESDAPVMSADLFPTFIELADGEPPEVQPVDGISVASLLKSSGRTAPERDAIYWHLPGYLQANEKAGTWRSTPCGAIRKGDYKLIEHFEDGRIELYNVAEDIGETKDLSAEQPDKARALHSQLVAWRASINARMPSPKTAARDR